MKKVGGLIVLAGCLFVAQVMAEPLSGKIGEVAAYLNSVDVNVEAGFESGDWRDHIWATVDGAKVAYLCVKKDHKRLRLTNACSPSSVPP